MLLVMYFLICFMEENTLTLELIFFICFAFWIDFFKLKKTVVVWSLSHVQHWNLKGRSTPSSSVSTISQSLLELIVIESVMLSNHLILCCPFLLFPSVFPSMRVFSNESALCIRRPKYGSFRFSINPSNVYPGFITFKIDFISLQSKGLSRVFSSTTIQKHQCSAFFIIRLAHLYMTTRIIVAVTICTFVGKVMSLILIHCRSVIAFLSRIKCLLIRITFLSVFGAQGNKICHCFYFFPFYLPWSDGTRWQVRWSGIRTSLRIFHSLLWATLSKTLA